MINKGTHFMKLCEWVPFDKLDWESLSQNPSAVPILEKNLDKVDWFNLANNPNAIHLLENNLGNLSWCGLSKNPNIFTYDYNAMKDRMFRGGIMEDLMKNRFNPMNLYKFKGWGFEGYDDE